MSYLDDRCVETIETKARMGPREFCLTIELNVVHIKETLRSRGWNVINMPSSLYGIDVIEVFA